MLSSRCRRRTSHIAATLRKVSRIWVSGVIFLDSGLEQRRLSWIESEICLILEVAAFSSESELEEFGDSVNLAEFSFREIDDDKTDEPGNWGELCFGDLGKRRRRLSCLYSDVTSERICDGSSAERRGNWDSTSDSDKLFTSSFFSEDFTAVFGVAVANAPRLVEHRRRFGLN